LAQTSISPLRRWIGRPVTAPEGQSATYVELFFDLVFVFALTEVTSYTVHHLDWGGVFRATLSFWLVWWAWTQWTWALNPADTEHGLVRLGTLGGTALAFLMAVSLGGAFEEDGGLWFVVPYIGVRIGGLALYAWVTSVEREQLAAVRSFALFSSAGLLAALVGGIASPEHRAWWWLGTVVLDFIAAGSSGRSGQWNLHPAHFAERHGLFVIIALGESLVVAAAVVVGAERSIELVGVAIGAVAVTCLLWWTYFGWFNEGLEERMAALSGKAQSTLARDTYSLMHFPLIAGIVGVAVGFEEMIAHPDEPLARPVLLALAAGVGLFLGASVLAWARAWGQVLWWRLAILVLLYPALALTAGTPPAIALAFIVLTLGALVAVEASLKPGQTARQEHAPR
jgi:low temperature requirement protein LtrA